jgi:hypothetical protein
MQASAAMIVVVFRIDESLNPYSLKENRGRTFPVAPDPGHAPYWAATFCLP